MANEKSKKIERIIQKEEEIKQMSHLVGAMAHQWKQPLNILGLLIQDIRDAYEFNEMDKAYLDNFVTKGMHNIREISHSIDGFRSFFNPRFETDHVDIKRCVQEIIAMLQHQYESHKIQIELSGDSFTRTLFLNSFRQGIMNILGVIKDTYDEIKTDGKKIDIVLDPSANSITIREFTGALDKAMIIMALEEETVDITALKVYTPIYNAKELLADSADAQLDYKEENGNFLFIISF